MADKRPKATQVEATIQEGVSEGLLRVSNAGPALLSNRVVVSVGPFGVRIAFTEQQAGGGEDTAEFRTAVVMSHEDGIRLYKLLDQLLKPVETAIAAAKADSENG